MTAHPGAVMAYRALDAIRLNPEQHDQLHWEFITSCGTTRCFAGWVNHLAGRPACNCWGLTAEQQMAQGRRSFEISLNCVLVGGRTYTVSQCFSAREVLHLDEDDAVGFFAEEASLEAIEAEVLEIFGPRPASMGPAPAGAGRVE